MTPDIIFIPGFLTKEEADDLLTTIHASADFRHYNSGYHKPRPRMEAWYGSWDYQYGGGETLKAQSIPDYLEALIVRIAEYGSFNGILINRYREGNQHVDWHSDDDYGDPFPTIPSITLGFARPVQFRLKVDGKVKAEHLPQHGDLLVMRGRTNADWKHRVPHTEKPVGERINLTFRNKF